MKIRLKLLDLPIISAVIVLIFVVLGESFIYLPRRVELTRQELAENHRNHIISGMHLIQQELDQNDFRLMKNWVMSVGGGRSPTMAWAIAPNGVVVASSDPEEAGTFFRFIENAHGLHINDLVVSGMREGIEVEREGDVYNWYVRMEFPPQSGYGRGKYGLLVARADMAASLDGVRRGSHSMLILVIGPGLLIILAMRLWFAHSYGQRIKSMLGALRQFGQGKKVSLDEDVKGDELGDIARGVRHLFGEIENKLQDIQDLSEQFQAIFQHNLDPVVVINPAGDILNVNLAAEESFGYDSESDLVGQKLTVLMDTLHAARHHKYVERHMKGDRSEVIDSMRRISARRKDGSRFPVDITVVDLQVKDETFFVGFIRDKSMAQAYENEIHRQLYFDDKTGLPNRISLEGHLENALAIKDAGIRYLLLEIGIDQMRSINATFGFGCGDVVITELAKRLSGALKSSDFICRLAGDRFVTLHELHDDEAPEKAMLDISSDIQKVLKTPVPVAGGAVEIRVTIGGLVIPELADNPVDAIQYSELALFEAKAHYRGNVYLLQGRDQKRIRDNAALVHEIRRAIQNNEFHVFYQPKVNLETGQVRAAECLVRWFKADGTMIPPDQFISVAEASGYIGHIGKFVIQRAFMALQKWRDDPVLGDIKLAVNVSPFELKNRGYVDEALAMAATYGVGLHRLELEITESSLGNESGLIKGQIASLREAGFPIAIDDFGTGESSLSKLKYIDVDRLKIDRSFLSDVETDSRSEALLEHVIELAQSQKMQVTVEGIEDEDMSRRIQRMGGDEGQGYLYSKPVPQAEFEAFVIDYNKKEAT